MDVKFIAVPSDSLDLVPIQNGQVIALSDVPGYYYDMIGTRYRVGSSVSSTQLPATGQTGVVYIATEGNEYYAPGIYFWNPDESKYVAIGVNRVKGSAEEKFRSGDVVISPKDLGLDKVENLSAEQILDKLAKQQVISALGYTPVSKDEKGVAGGVASLNAEGKVPTEQLPPSREALIVVDSISTLPSPGTKGTLYQASDSGNFYIWNGATYVGLSSMGDHKLYQDFKLQGSSSAFYNNFCVFVGRNSANIDPNLPSHVTVKFSVVNADNTALVSTVIATAIFGTSGNVRDGVIVDALADHSSDSALINSVCVANLTAGGWAYGTPSMVGFNTTTQDGMNVSVDIVSYSNCVVYFADSLIRQGALSTSYYSSTSSLVCDSTGRFGRVTSFSEDANVSNNDGQFVTGARLYQIFGNSSQVSASRVKFLPSGDITATDVQSAIEQAARQGGGSGGITIIDWEDWKDMSDTERDAAGVVVVTNTPDGEYTLEGAYAEIASLNLRVAELESKIAQLS